MCFFIQTNTNFLHANPNNCTLIFYNKLRRIARFTSGHFLDSHVDCNFFILACSIPLMNVNTIILIIHSDIIQTNYR